MNVVRELECLIQREDLAAQRSCKAVSLGSKSHQSSESRVNSSRVGTLMTAAYPSRGIPQFYNRKVTTHRSYFLSRITLLSAVE